MKENPLKNKTVGVENTEIALEIYIKETEGVLIIRSGLQHHTNGNTNEHQ